MRSISTANMYILIYVYISIYAHILVAFINWIRKGNRCPDCSSVKPTLTSDLQICKMKTRCGMPPRVWTSVIKS